MKGDQVLQQLGSKSRIFMKRHSATILTCVGAAGVVATTVTAVKATPKAMRLIEEAKAEKGEELTKLEVVKAAGPVYIPTLLLGTTTITCVFGANILNKKHQATLASAYALLDNSYKEYKKKVEELYGEDAKKEITAGIAKDHLAEDDLSDLDFGDGKEMYFDDWSKHRFEAKPEDVIAARYFVNRQVRLNSGASVNEYYKFLNDCGANIPIKQENWEIGWSTGILESMYWTDWVDFDDEIVYLDGGMECNIISFRQEPVFDFAYY